MVNLTNSNHLTDYSVILVIISCCCFAVTAMLCLKKKQLVAKVKPVCIQQQAIMPCETYAVPPPPPTIVFMRVRTMSRCAPMMPDDDALYNGSVTGLLV